MVKRTFIAMTLLFGTLVTARADILPLSEPDAWTEALNIRAEACVDKPGAQNNAFVHSPKTQQCARDRAERRTARTKPGERRFACSAEVLHSEELSGAPIFYHHVRATLRVMPRGSAAFETIVEKQIAWQVPPPRKGRRLTLRCDPADLHAVTFL
jgi:hypothetical protein